MNNASSPSWQTWNVRSVLAHVRMPEAFGVLLGLFEFGECKYLRECLIGRPEQPGHVSTANDLTGIEDVHSETRLIDAHYTGVTITWREITARVRSACVGEDLFLLVEPVTLPKAPVLLTVEAGVLWGRPGGSERVSSGRGRAKHDKLVLFSGKKSVEVHATAACVQCGQFPAVGAHLALRLDRPIGMCTGRRRTLAEIRRQLLTGCRVRDTRLSSFGPQAGLAGAMYSALGWTTIYKRCRGEAEYHVQPGLGQPQRRRAAVRLGHVSRGHDGCRAGGARLRRELYPGHSRHHPGQRLRAQPS